MANLLPTTEREALGRERRGRFISALLVLVSGLFLFGSALTTPSLVTLYLSRASIDERLEATKQLVGLQKGEGASAELGLIKEKLDVIENARHARSPRQIIEEVVSLIPSGVRLRNIVFDRDGGVVDLDLTGVAGNRAALLAFGDALRRSELFSTVEIPIESLAQNTNLQFKLSLELKDAQ